MEQRRIQVPLPYFADRHVSVYHGDCRELLRSIASESIELVLTDPPYGVDYRGRWCSEWEAIAGDDEPTVTLPAFSEVWRALKPNAFCLSFYGWPDAEQFLNAWKLIGFRPVSHLVCVKNNIGLGYFARSQHETAYLLAKGRPVRPHTAVGDVFEWEREPLTYHPCQKPLRVISRLIAAFSAENAVILDPFMGSGTTILAARNLGRRAIGIEIDKRYCEVARERLAQQVFDFGQESLPLQPESDSPFGAQRMLQEGEQSWTA
jgi:site-specific DNA-methyltransferase (adenine-specific)